MRMSNCDDVARVQLYEFLTVDAHRKLLFTLAWLEPDCRFVRNDNRAICQDMRTDRCHHKHARVRHDDRTTG